MKMVKFRDFTSVVIFTIFFGDGSYTPQKSLRSSNGNEYFCSTFRLFDRSDMSETSNNQEIEDADQRNGNGERQYERVPDERVIGVNEFGHPAVGPFDCTRHSSVSELIHGSTK